MDIFNIPGSAQTAHTVSRRAHTATIHVLVAMLVGWSRKFQKTYWIVFKCNALYLFCRRLCCFLASVISDSLRLKFRILLVIVSVKLLLKLQYHQKSSLLLLSVCCCNISATYFGSIGCCCFFLLIINQVNIF